MSFSAGFLGFVRDLLDRFRPDLDGLRPLRQAPVMLASHLHIAMSEQGGCSLIALCLARRLSTQIVEVVLVFRFQPTELNRLRYGVLPGALEAVRGVGLAVACTDNRSP